MDGDDSLGLDTIWILCWSCFNVYSILRYNKCIQIVVNIISKCRVGYIWMF